MNKEELKKHISAMRENTENARIYYVINLRGKIDSVCDEIIFSEIDINDAIDLIEGHLIYEKYEFEGTCAIVDFDFKPKKTPFKKIPLEEGCLFVYEKNPVN